MKRLLTLLILAFFLTGTPIQANAAPELIFDSAEVFQGQTASLNLSLAGGTEDYAGINVTIRLPENITFNTVSKGDLTDSGFTLDYSPDGSRIIVYSTSSTFSGNGILFSLSIKADDDATAGEQDIIFVTDNSGLLNPNALSNSDGSKSVSPTLINGKITILEDVDRDGLPDDWEMEHFGNLDQGADDDFDEDGYTNSEEYENGTDPKTEDYYLRGDLNGDGILDIKDIIVALQVSCGMTPEKVKTEGDVNEDGKIGVDEAIFILWKISGN